MFGLGGLKAVLFSKVNTLELSVTAAAGMACVRNTTFTERPTQKARATTATRLRTHA